MVKILYVSRVLRPVQGACDSYTSEPQGFSVQALRWAPQSQTLVPGIWKGEVVRRAKEFFLQPLNYKQEKRGFYFGHRNGMNSEMENQRTAGEGGSSARRKGKAFLSGDARSRGVFSTWTLTIGGDRTDVPELVRTRTAAKAVLP